MLFVFSLALALAGQPAKPSLTTLRGHIAHPLPTDSVHLIAGYKDTLIAVSKRGDFQCALPNLTQAVPTKLEYGDRQTQLYLTPGDRVVLRADYPTFNKSLTYKGRGSKVNMYLAQAEYKFEYGPPVGALRPSAFAKGTPARAQQGADSLRLARQEFLKAYAQGHALPAAFVREQQLAIDCTWATQQLGYAYKHRSETMPTGYFDFMSQVPVKEVERLRTRSMIDNSRLANLMISYPVRLAPQGKLTLDPQQGERICVIATRELGDGQARAWAIGTLFQQNLIGNAESAKFFYQGIKRLINDSTLVKSFRERLLALDEVNGKLAPAFTLLNRNKQQVSLSDFRGKVVYLDFWGTWCPPCMRELKDYAPGLRQKMFRQDIVFLHISTGDSEARWLEITDDERFTSFNSIHLYAPDNRVANLYNVGAYPSYFIIGRDGKIIQASAPRPSDTEAVSKALEEALR